MSLSGDIISDMQMDASIEAIGEIAGSINLDGSGSTPTITASATVSPDPGIPACDVVKTGTDEYPNFAFNFSGLKGNQGDQGIPGQDGENGSDGITPVISATASASNTTGVPAVTVTKTGTDAAPNFDFYFENLKGERGVAGPTGESGPQGPSGNDGVTPNITATGSVTNTTGVPSVTITKTGTDLAPTFDFAFENIKGEQGLQGDPGRNGADGSDGVTPIISATASVDDAVGIPNVVITRSGTDAAPNYDFAFHNLKGTQGNPGEGVPSGGTTDQVLVKQSSTDYDADWETLTIPSTASEISFDNTGTGMTSTDVQDAVTELKSNLADKASRTWIYVGYGATVTIPEDYTEALIYIFGRNTSGGNRRIGAQLTFLPQLWGEQLSNKIEFLVAGYHISNTDHGYGSIAVTNNGKSFSIQGWTYGNGNAADTYVMVYYRK